MNREPRAVIIPADAPAALTMLCGISLLERLLRVLQRLKIAEVTIVSTTPDEIRAHLAQPSWARSGIRVEVRHVDATGVSPSEIATSPAAVLSVAFYDSRLLRALLAQRTTTLLVDSAPPPAVRHLSRNTGATSIGCVAHAALLDRAWLATAAPDEPLFPQLTRAAERNEIARLDAAAQPRYVTSMRRSIRPVCFPPPSPQNIAAAERIVFDTAQNGTLDLPALVHAPIETWVIARLCRTPVKPNQITLFTALVSAAVALLFAFGSFTAGTILALIVGVLDGLDGKQARVKIETTPLGQREHALDYVLELAWWTALAFYFTRTGEVSGAYGWLLLLVGSDLIDRLAKKHAKQKTGRNLDDVAPIDRFMRLIGGRRNIYIWIFAAGLLVHAPGKAFIALCGWGALTAAVHVWRTVWISCNPGGLRAEGAPH